MTTSWQQIGGIPTPSGAEEGPGLRTGRFFVSARFLVALVRLCLVRRRLLVTDEGLIPGMEGVIHGMGRFILKMNRPRFVCEGTKAGASGFMPRLAREFR